MTTLFKNPQALIITVVLAVISYLVAPFIPAINSIILGLFLGMILGNVYKFKGDVSSNISTISSKSLEFSILFIAFSIDYGQLQSSGLTVITIIVIMITAILIGGKLISRFFTFNSSTSWLISFGTAICGSSAIAALAPSVTKDKEEVGISIAVVNLLGTLGMVTIPFILPTLGLTEQDQGLFIGASLHSLGNVAGAGFAAGTEVGETAVTIKLARIALLSPALIIINLFINKGKQNNWKKILQLPWYLLGFILISIVASATNIPADALSFLGDTAKFLLTIAMVAIGLKMSFSTLLTSGKKGLQFGFVLFALQLLVLSLLVWILL